MELPAIEVTLLASRVWPGLRFRASISMRFSLLDGTAVVHPSGILFKTNVSAPSSEDAVAPAKDAPPTLGEGRTSILRPTGESLRQHQQYPKEKKTPAELSG